MIRSSSGMAWENTLLASRILPPAYMPVDAATNRSQDASLMLEQDGRLTLLVILTTSAGLAIVLLFFILLRIGCLRSNSCFGGYKDREDRSPCLTAVVLDDRASTKSLAASQQTIQTTFLQTRSDLDPCSNYTIKLVDNDLIVETQSSSEFAEPTAMTETTPATPPPPNPLLIQVPSAAGASSSSSSSEQQKQQQQPSSEQSGFLLFKTWLSVIKSKGLDDGVVIISPPGNGGGQETKSLCGSPSYRHYGDREEMLASQKQQILARFGQNLPGFGFTQSKNSCLFEDDEDDPPTSPYSYRHGNQVEYMGGPYGYVDPLFSHQLLPASSKGRRTTVRLEELDVVVQRQRIPSEPASSSNGSSRQEPPPLLLLPTFVRSAESLVVLSKEHQRVDGNTSATAAADRRLIVANGSD